MNLDLELKPRPSSTWLWAIQAISQPLNEALAVFAHRGDEIGRRCSVFMIVGPKNDLDQHRGERKTFFRQTITYAPRVITIRAPLQNAGGLQFRQSVGEKSECGLFLYPAT